MLILGVNWGKITERGKSAVAFTLIEKGACVTQTYKICNTMLQGVKWTVLMTSISEEGQDSIFKMAPEEPQRRF